MIREVHIGPMWSGKTTALDDLDELVNLVIVDFYNTRNSSRDLSSLKQGCRFLRNMDEVLAYPSVCSLSVLVDEVHFFSCDEMSQILDHFDDAQIWMAGLLVDCYKNFELFPVWKVVLPLANQVVRHYFRGSCAVCGSTKDVAFTIPQNGIVYKNGNVEKIGDHYMNVCKKCAYAQTQGICL